MAGGNMTPEAARLLAANCPAGALTETAGGVSPDFRRCVHCFKCGRATNSGPLLWDQGYEWAKLTREANRLGRSFSRSLHIRMVDTGACGACLSEMKQLGSPYYNMHRLGFFITPTPRMADVLMVTGPLTGHMRLALEKTYEAIPSPKIVIAVGTCALTGGVFGPSFATEGGISKVIPVDIEVPGCPPPPLAILHTLLTAAGRKSPGKEER